MTRAAGADATTTDAEVDVLEALARIIDPDFGEDIVSCGFVKDLDADASLGVASFRLLLTTPACPVKAEFERLARLYVGEVPWVTQVNVVMDAEPPKPSAPAAERPGGLANVKHIIAVSSCKGGVGKSTTAVNLAFTLLQMGGRVGIFDADVYGPSLPTMTNPEVSVLIADPKTRELSPVEYEGVKCMSFGWAGQGAAIMRGAMTSGLITQLLTQTKWGELDYLVVDFPPGTGDIQLTLCQTMGISAAVVVTTPQKLAYVDVVKGIRMFARLQVPCVAAVENMSYFDGDDGKRYFPFGSGSGERIRNDFGVPHLLRFPISPAISSAGDSGSPLVVSDPSSDTAAVFMALGAAVVREIAKLEAIPRNAVRFDEEVAAFAISLPSGGSAPGTSRPLPAKSEGRPTDAAQVAAAGYRAAQQRSFHVDPMVVRLNDTSAVAIDEWTGERLAPQVTAEMRPTSIASCGNYAVQIMWEDGFNQVAPFELLATLDRLTPEQLTQRKQAVINALQASSVNVTGVTDDTPSGADVSTAQRILADAQLH